MPEENLINRKGVALGLPVTPIVPDIPVGGNGSGSATGRDGGNMSVNDMFLNIASKTQPTGAEEIPLSSIYKGDRYDATRPGTDYEEMAAQQQSSYDKWRNATVKLAGVTATSFVSGTAGLVYGLGAAAKEGRWASLIDNDVTRAMDESMKKLEDIAPNYYTHKETDASWYYPDNILTANFFSDKIMKNLGYSIGALGGGLAWTSLFRSMGMINSLVRAGQGLATVEATEAAMSTVPKLGKYAAFEDALAKMSQTYVKSPLGAVLSDSERILTSSMGTFGEAAMEGLQGMNKFRDENIKAFFDKNGRNPNEAELASINETADKMGMYIWGANSLLLTGTNYIQLPKILGSSRRAEKAMISGLRQEAVEGAEVGAIGGAFERATPLTKLGRIASGAKAVSGLLFAPSEAFEEGMQSSIQTGVTNYFQRAYDNKGETVSFMKELRNVMGSVFDEGIADTLTTKEGMESILIGGISGGIQQAGYIGTYKNEQGKTRVGIGKSGTIAERGVFGQGGETGRNTEEALLALNKTNVKKSLQDQVKFLGIGIGSQKLRQEAIANDDKLAEKDYEADFALSYIMPRVKYGKIDAVNQELGYYKSQAMSDNGFNALIQSGIAHQKETKEQFIARIDNLLAVAKNTDQLYDNINDKYSNRLNDKNERLYTDDAVDKMVYSASKIKDYDKRIPGINNDLIKTSINTTDIIKDVLAKGDAINVPSYTAAIAEIEAMDTDVDTITDLKESLEDLVEISLRRVESIKEYKDIVNNPQNFKAEEFETPDMNAPRETVVIATNKGKVRVEVGTEYILGDVTPKKSFTGKDVYEGPVLTVLVINPDGTIKVKTSNGKIRDIDADTLESYKLSKLSTLRDNPKASFYYDNWNTVYQHHGVKINGKSAVGRLFYHKAEDKLVFVYNDENGKLQQVEVWNTMFSQNYAKSKGYNQPMINNLGQLTVAQEASTKAFIDAKVSFSEKIKRRNAIISDLYNTTKERIDTLVPKLEKAKQTLATEEAKLNERLKEASLTKKGTPRVRPTALVTSLARELSELRNTLSKDITEMEAEIVGLEASIPHIQSFLEDLDSTSENGREMMKSLKKDVTELKELITVTEGAIKQTKTMIDHIDELLQKALNVFNDYIANLKKMNPNIPLFIEDLQERVEKALGPEGTEYYIANRQGLTDRVRDLEADLTAFGEAVKYPSLSKQASTIATDLQDLQKGLDDLVGQHKAKEMILEAFEDFVEREKEAKEQEQKLQSNEELRKALIGTLNKEAQNFWSSTPYEAESKKPDIVVVTATRPIDDGKLHQKRANHFGARLPKFKNKERIRGMVVTQKTQDQILPGLVEHLLGNISEEDKAKYPAGEVLALVMVEVDKKGNIFLVDENGVRIAPEADVLNSAIYQVFPAKTLASTYTDKEGNKKYGSMFREDTADNVKESLTEQYSNWVDSQLAMEQLGQPEAIDASFGLPELKKTKNDKGVDIVDHSARTSVSEAGLVTGNMLDLEPVIDVVTSDAPVSRGNVTFKSPKGRVFLALPNGLAKLFNRKFSDKEANVIYDVLLQISKNLLEVGENGGVNDPAFAKNDPLFKWLRSTVYWGFAKKRDGTRKPGGYNNIWFEEVTEAKNEKKLRLFISGKTTDTTQAIEFVPSELVNRKGDIISLITALYNNTSNHLTNGTAWNNKYQEVTGVKEDGTLETREWKNYQTFLLSDKNPDNTKRDNAEIPLVTKFEPIVDENSTNRKAIYFTLKSGALNYTRPEPIVKEKPKAPVAPVAKPVAKETKPAPAKVSPTVVTTPEGYIFDGATVNKVALNIGEGSFTLDIDRYVVDGTGLFITVPTELLQSIMTKTGRPEEEAREIGVQSIKRKIDPVIDDAIQARQLQEETPVEETPEVPEVPVGAIVPATVPQFDLGGTVVNTVSLGGFEGATFTIDAAKFNAGETKSLVMTFPGEMIKGMMDKFGDDQETAVQRLQASLVRKIQPQLDAVVVAENSSTPIETPEPEVTQEPVETEKQEEQEDKVQKEEPQGVSATVETEISVAANTTVENPGKKKRFSLGDIDASGAPQEHNYRIQVIDEANTFEGEDWTKVEAWLTKAFPNLPVYRVKNIIKASNGRQAWGALHDGAIYLYENAEVGTVYHEVFEAVWKMFAGQKEKDAVTKEFRNRPGYYQDRFTGEKVKYSRASNAQLKEELAEEFRDKVLFGKNPTKVKGNLISRLFDDLLSFIRSFFTGRDALANTTELFDKIGNGYYKSYNPYLTKLSFAQSGVIDIDGIDVGDSAELRVANVPAKQLHDIIQFMTYETLRPLVESNEVLFSVTNMLQYNKTDLYNDLLEKTLTLLKRKVDILVVQRTANGTLTAGEQNEYNNTVALFDTVQDEWDNIIDRHTDYLKTYSLEFDDNDEMTINSGEETGKADWIDARKVDSFRKSNSAIKLLLGTLPAKGFKNGVPVDKYSSIGGPILLPADQVHIDLMNRLHDTIDAGQMIIELQKLAIKKPEYGLLFKRLTGKLPSTSSDVFSDIKESDYRLISSFWRTMKKQNADVVTIFIKPAGDVIVSDSTLASAANQAKREMVSKMITTIKKDQSSFFSYEKKTGRYRATQKLKDAGFSSDIKSYLDFLGTLGITFTTEASRSLGKPVNPDHLKSLLSDRDITMLKEVVPHIKESLEKIGEKVKAKNDAGQEITLDTGLITLSTNTMDIDKRMSQLGIIQAILDNPEYESTYFNINGERTQSYVGVNAVSNFYDVISKVDNLTEDLQEESNKGYRYLLHDSFVKGSMMLKKMFVTEEDGSYTDRIRTGTEDFMKPVFVDGTVDESTGRKKESSRLSYKQRFIQEINLNLDGIYLNLVPGDASIEHAVRMHYKDNAFVTQTDYDADSYLNIFRDYFISEVNLAKEGRIVVAGRNNSDLRFFNSILGKDIHDEIMHDEDNEGLSADELYTKYEKVINDSVTAFIEVEAETSRNLFKTFDLIKRDPDTDKLQAAGLNFTSEELEEAYLMKKLRTLASNYIIANIELHKLIYSDPYQYADELKRIKNFNSPRQALLFGSPEINAFLHENYNKGVDAEDKSAFSDMQRDYFRTITLGDVWSKNDNLNYDDPYEETDGGGYITIQGARKFRLRVGDWSPANERQFQFDLYYEKRVKEGAIQEELVGLIKQNPGIKDTYVPLKPIVSGNKQNGRDYNDTLLHKFALVPLSYRIAHELQPGSNAIKLYDKMIEEDIDYAVYSSGSKVGTETVHELYNEDGTFNETIYEDQKEKDGLLAPNEKRGVTNVPFSIIGLQTEVPSKDTPLVTQGSQITKLATMDFLEAGVPIDFMRNEDDFNKRFVAWNSFKTVEEREKNSDLYKEIKHNQNLLEAKTLLGYETLLKKLGITKTDEGFKISNTEKLVKTLEEEVLKREVNDNILDAFDGFKKGHVVLEATPAYQQIRNILFSIADKNVVRPKISGGMKVQIPSTLLLETNRIKVDSFTKKGETKNVFSSDVLGFYKNQDGERVCEIMVGRWFKSDKTDDELMEYFNETPEGQEQLSALTGIAFRIPTQKQNSIDAFKIKKFLPKDFGDSVVVPSALVKKAGSDFDIDKLSIYLKNLFTDVKGNIKTVPYFGIGQAAKDKFAELYDNGSLNKYIAGIKDALPIGGIEDRLLESIFTEEYSIQREDIIDGLYRKSLENEYIQSLENLTTHELNYDALVKPNSAEDLKALSADINKRKGVESGESNNVGNMLKRGFMSRLRHDFVTGKQAIGIAAVAQTNHAINQRTPVYLDFRKMMKETFNALDRTILGGDIKAITYSDNPSVNFKHYNTINIDGLNFPTLSKIKAAGKQDEYISDTIGMFIDGYVDIAKGAWIMEMGATPNTAGTWLFLVKIGVPIADIAYFMNQPIISSYLQQIENKGQTWLFSEKNISNMLELYSIPGMPIEEATEKIREEISGIPNVSILKVNVGKYVDDLSDGEKLQQQFMLKEFVKYAKMASQLFEVVQGSNYDTANFNDPYLIFKKRLQLEKARNTIISAVDDLLGNSFVGTLKTAIEGYRDAFAEVLISDRPRVRSLMEDVLKPYVAMSDRDFVKLSQKAVNDLFDWAVQNDRKINETIGVTLLGTDTEDSAAEKIMAFKDSILGNPEKGIPSKPNHPLYDNMILNSVRIEEGSNDRKVDNLYLAGRDNKIYDQNLIINSFNEMREHLKSENSDLYGKFVRLGILQSGLSKSKISYTTLLPYADFKEIYNQTLFDLENYPSLRNFYNLNVFERNNWNNNDIVPQVRGNIKKFPDKLTGVQKTYDLNLADFVLGIPLAKAVRDFLIPQVVNLDVSSQEGRADFITYSTETYIPFAKKILAKKTGDRSHIKKYLMQKVYTTNERNERVPLIKTSMYKGKPYSKYIYKAINAWGDSFRAQEFYNEIRPSKLDNDFVKIEKIKEVSSGRMIWANEVDDELIVGIVNGIMPAMQPENKNIEMLPDNIAKIKSGMKTITNRSVVLPDGEYILPDGTNVILKSKGFWRVFSDDTKSVYSVNQYNRRGEFLPKDDFARAEGFNDWADFVENNKFSDNFVKGNEGRYVYDIKAVAATEIPYTEVISDKGITKAEWDSFSQEKKQNLIDC